MTSKLDIVKEWTDAPTKSVEDSAAYISDNFQSVNSEGKVEMNKEAWSGMYHMLLNSFPDWTYVRSELREDGDKVIMTGHFEGTFSKDFDMSAMGMGVIPASGKKIVWPEATSKVSVEGGKIKKLEPVGEGNGMEDFIAQLTS